MVELRPGSPPVAPRIRDELAATDWSTHPIVDVVIFLPATSRGLEGDRQRVELYRHGGARPRSAYRNEERSVRVERWTYPLFERHLVEPDAADA